jgi:hypothetical protein
MKHFNIYPFKQTILYTAKDDLKYKVPVTFDAYYADEHVTTVWVQIIVPVEKRFSWMLPGYFRVTVISHKNKKTESRDYRSYGRPELIHLKRRFMDQAFDQIKWELANHYCEDFDDPVASMPNLIEL